MVVALVLLGLVVLAVVGGAAELGSAVAMGRKDRMDLVAELPHFGWPTVVVSGGRDLITPPAVAERVAAHFPSPTDLFTMADLGG